MRTQHNVNSDLSPIADAWQRIRRWFEANLPSDHRDQLNWGEPASNDALDGLQKKLRRKLPAAFRESYKLYDGQDCRVFEYDGHLGRTMSIAKIDRALGIKEGVREYWDDLDKEEIADIVHCDPAIKCKFWNRYWLPFTDSGSGDHFCIDLDPSPLGKAGQIIYASHETGPSVVIAPSFEDMLFRQADDFDHGKYVFDDEAWQIRRV